MNKNRMRILEVVLLFALPISARATPWHTLGPRAMGMGGAHVAIAQGPLASYWNPAGLGQLHNISGLEIPAGIHGEFAGSVLEGANDVNQLREDCAAVPPRASCTSARVIAALNKLGQPGNGAFVDAGGGFNFKIKKVVLFANNLTYIGATPRVDLVNTGACLGAGCIDQNQSKLTLRGGSFTEIGLGYGQEIFESGIILGANVKGIVGRVGYHDFDVIREDPGSTKAFQKFDRATKTSFQGAVDLGFLWDMRESLPMLPMRPRLGVVARNINNPTFDQPDAAKTAGDRNRFSLHGQTRAGLALSPFKFWHLAADIDVTENLTYVDGFKSRILAAGTEINVFNRSWINIPLRAGLQKNIASDSGVTFAGGFGLNFLHVMVDVAGMVSSKTTKIQTEGQNREIPNNVAGALRLAFLFGGKDEGARNKY